MDSILNFKEPKEERNIVLYLWKSKLSYNENNIFLLTKTLIKFLSA